MYCNDDKEELINKYRKPLYETKNVGPRNIDGCISDDDLHSIIRINNEEMFEMIKTGNIDYELLSRLFYANLNFYDLANYRRISMRGKDTMVMAAMILGYNLDKLNYVLNKKVYEAHYLR